MKAAANTTAKRKTRKKKRPPLPEPKPLSSAKLLKGLDLLASGAHVKEMLAKLGDVTWLQFNRALNKTEGGQDRYREAIEQRKRYWEVEADERMHEEAMRTDKEVVTTKGEIVVIQEANTKALTYWHGYLHPTTANVGDADTEAALRSAHALVRLGDGA